MKLINLFWKDGTIEKLKFSFELLKGKVNLMAMLYLVVAKKKKIREIIIDIDGEKFKIIKDINVNDYIVKTKDYSIVKL